MKLKAYKWVLYDLAHTGFTMIVMAMLFPIMFNKYFADGLSDAAKTSSYGFILGIASVVVALASPFLAAFAQTSGLRMKLMRGFVAIGVAGMAALFLIQQGQWLLAGTVYIAAAIGFFCANLFYDSLLIDVSNDKNRHTISGVAFSVGYFGGVALLGLIVFWTQIQDWPAKWLFVIGAIWWLALAFPLILCSDKGKKREDREERRENSVPENLKISQNQTSIVSSPSSIVNESSKELSFRSALLELAGTAKEFWHNRQLRWFILAYFFYIDGVGTVVNSAARYGDALGFAQEKIIIAFFVVQFFGIPCALLFGLLGKKFGARPILFISLALYILVVFFASIIEATPYQICGFDISPMFVLAAAIGMVQGGVQALSRSYFASIVPAGKEVSFFGFYSMIGRCSTVIGPYLLAGTAILFDRGAADPLFSTRAGFACLSLLFLAGIVFLALIPKTTRSRER